MLRAKSNGFCAVVLGGTSGLREAIAMGLADAGWHVVAASRSEDGVANTADAIQAAGRRTLRATADVADRTALNRKIIDSPRGQELQLRTPMARFGRADELVSTAVCLASEDSTYTTGQIITVDGGMLSSGVNQ